jgi:DNA-directed RNA polymerase beta' subunit
MAGFSYKNKKFPLKAVPTVLVTVLTSFTVTIMANILLQDKPDFLDLSLFESEEIEYEFQTILETNNFEDLESLELKAIEECEYYAQSGSFRTEKAAQSQVDQLSKLGYEAAIENVNSSNGYNFKVIVGPFENRSQTNNAREIFRQLNMDSIEIPVCTKIENES